MDVRNQALLLFPNLLAKYIDNTDGAGSPSQVPSKQYNVVTTLSFGCDNVVSLRCDNVKM